jgi:hypothetical protein
LRPLHGQDLVSTSQLGVGVLNCLRQIDDIAYLRWATLMKNIESVAAFHAEARALVEHPSPRLKFAGHIARPIELVPIDPTEDPSLRPHP